MSAKKGKLIINGVIKLLTGLHIGCGGQGGIGLVDSPIIRNPRTNEPYIPGSSLKGRLRHSLVDMLSGIESSPVKELFGTTPSKEKSNSRCTSRIYVRDAHLELKQGQKLQNLIEIKYENCIDRRTGTTKTGALRQIERVIAGTNFSFEIVYVLGTNDEEHLKNLEASFKFLEDEYLGASGSRGYGKVKFHFKELCYKSIDCYMDKTKEEKKDSELTSGNWAEKALELIKQ